MGVNSKIILRYYLKSISARGSKYIFFQFSQTLSLLFRKPSPLIEVFTFDRNLTNVSEVIIKYFRLGAFDGRS